MQIRTTMGSRVWLAVPVERTNMPDSLPKPKYPIDGNATLIYDNDVVYISFENEENAVSLMNKAGVRNLTPEEIQKLDKRLPYPFLSRESINPSVPMSVGLGDVISWILKKVGFSECDGCRKRKDLLNRFTLWTRKSK